ncbi:MAG: OmpH family outer membrane protein [Candidatus Omnitrophica bacterium]|nr:OmpH family outer membrane protein [Candidatus Omnitrophota bacterium]
MRWIKIITLISFAIMISAQPLFAQRPPRIAYINAAKVFDGYHKTKEADQNLEKEGKKKNTERERLVKEINKLKDEVELLSQKARGKKETILNEKLRGLQDFDNEAKLSLQRKRNDMVKVILKEIDDVIKAYGSKNGFDIIMDSRVLLHANVELDISDDIVRELNKKR